MKPIIIRDTREKTGVWEFENQDWHDRVEEIKLKTGDYSLHGYEDVLCIERKRTVAEWAVNVFESRFEDWLSRMQTYKHRFIICEFNMNDILRFPVGSNIPKWQWERLKVSPEYMLSCMNNIRVSRNIHIIYAGDRDNAMREAASIMKWVHKNGKTNTP